MLNWYFSLDCWSCMCLSTILFPLPPPRFLNYGVSRYLLLFTQISNWFFGQNITKFCKITNNETIGWLCILTPILLHLFIINNYFMTKRRSLASCLAELPSFKTNNIFFWHKLCKIGDQTCISLDWYKKDGSFDATYIIPKNHH